MECKDLIFFLSDYIDGELDPKICAELDQHLNKCESCRIVFNTFEKTIYLFKEIEPHKLPDGVHNRLHKVIKESWETKMRIHFKTFASNKMEIKNKKKEVETMSPIKRYHPLAEISKIEDMFDRYLNQFFRDFFPKRMARGELARVEWTPAIDIVDKGTHFLLRSELPGLKREDISISVTTDSIDISGETKRSEEEKKENYYKCERYYGSFSRSLQIPADVVPDKVEASLKDGILEVKLPKKEVKKVKAIDVKVK